MMTGTVANGWVMRTFGNQLCTGTTVLVPSGYASMAINVTASNAD